MRRSRRSYHRNADEDLRRRQRAAASGAQRELDRAVVGKIRAGRPDLLTLGEIKNASWDLIPHEVLSGAVMIVADRMVHIDAWEAIRQFSGENPEVIGIHLSRHGAEQDCLANAADWIDDTLDEDEAGDLVADMHYLLDQDSFRRAMELVNERMGVEYRIRRGWVYR
jgi:hypothetical protein